MPSRFLWFIFGGVAATYWLSKKERLCDFKINHERRQIHDNNWDERRAQLSAFRDQAADSAAEYSEAALDSIATTVEMLKRRLAERRAMQQNDTTGKDQAKD
ncbi:hypothetical protein Clacol_009499 [Clathrus columnatus]|uniref:Uncharacterized protein n=1 Tax=Clathrus columnatus TaxID=1419009 RepID=A0AAV5ARA9_9AGAM|nr:hypothetical protein Clacol_009499 [Clathrus columnatus]